MAGLEQKQKINGCIWREGEARILCVLCWLWAEPGNRVPLRVDTITRFYGNETRELQPRQYAVFHGSSSSHTHLLTHRKSLPIHRSLMNHPVSRSHRNASTAKRSLDERIQRLSSCDYVLLCSGSVVRVLGPDVRDGILR